jgi:serine phosphatase RsbU (regulator of sigma subunit)
MAGLHTRASAGLEEAVSVLEGQPEHGLFHAQALAFAGLVARADCDWATGARHLLTAAECRRTTDPAASALWLALATEALCAHGMISEAQRAVETSPGGARLTDLASTVLHLARGNLAEGVQLASAVTSTPEASPWAVLFQLEGKLDLSRPTEVETGALALLARLEQAAEFDELYVRTTLLVARWAVEVLWVSPVAGSAAEFARAQNHLRRALASTAGFERYRAAAIALSAQLMDLRSNGSGNGTFNEALVLLEATGTPLELGLQLARRAAFLTARGQLHTRPLIARGRDVLTRAGAAMRSLALAQVETGAEAQSSVFASRSLMGRSLVAGALGDDDVELQAVFKVNQAISSVLELEDLLQKVLDEVVKLLKAERGALLRRNPDGSLHCVAARGVPPDKVREGEDEISFSVVREVERTGEVTLTDNAQLDERFRGNASVMAGDIRSLMCAPLKTQKELYGFLYLDSTLRSRVFKDSHRELLAVFATQAAVAIENALAFAEVEDLNANLENRVAERTVDLQRANTELTARIDELTQTRLKLLEAQKAAVDKEMQIARRIQQSILPGREVVRRPGLALLGQVEPATQVGGDFWTALDLSDGRTVLLIGDVTGHGVGPGMLTTVARTCCGTVIRNQKAVELVELLSVLSDVLFESSKGELTMTAFALMIDPKAKKLEYVNCGHVLPLYIEAAGGLPRLTVLAGPGAILGGQRGTSFETRSRSFAARDRVLLYTDGLIECTNPTGESFGDKRLQRAAIAAATAPIERHLESVMGTAREFYSGHPCEDDVSLVLAELGAE